MSGAAQAAHGAEIKLGLRENWRQFSLLAVVNTFVGGLVGLERTVVPLVATEEFRIGSEVVVFSFIIAFGMVKAFANLASGVLADRLRARPCSSPDGSWDCRCHSCSPTAPWAWIVGANVLLGISQGLAWSMTVNMKIDLVGPRHRGLAMGLNEAAGYGTWA